MELRELFLGYGLRVTGYGLRVTGYGLRILSDNLFFSNLAAGFASLVVLLHHSKRATIIQNTAARDSGHVSRFTFHVSRNE